MKRTKKIVTLALAMVLLVCTTVMATVAYLQSTTEVVKNTFTVGKVKITLDEADVNEYGEKLYETENGKLVASEDELEEGDAIKTENGVQVLAERVRENEYKLIPSHEYVKDPTVHVAADSEESYIRMIVTIGDLADVKAVLGADFLPQYFVEGWSNDVWKTTGVVKEDTTANTATYEFRYHKAVDTLDGKALDLEPLFTAIVVPEGVDNTNLAKLEELEINVIAHAIQADGFEDENEAWAAFE